MPKLNIENEVYGRFTVLKLAPSRGTHTYWLCKCECGELREIEVANLRGGKTKSCGCLRDELAKVAAKAKFTTHGDHATRLYRIYKHMHQRCELPSHTAYSAYGAKGIRVTQDWATYEAFKSWALNHGYSDSLTLDREDGTKGYCPDNCRWATYETQTRNRRKTVSKTTSTFIGVTWCIRRKAWKAMINVSGKAVNLGSYSTELEAAHVRDNYIVQQSLEHFKLNF